MFSLLVKSCALGGALAVALTPPASLPALANSAASVESALPFGAVHAGKQPATDEHDKQFREQFAAWQSLEKMGAPAPAHVTFGRAADALGRPVYPFRRTTSGSGVELSFSSRRPVGLAMATGPLPSGMPVAAGNLTSGFGRRAHPILGMRRAHAGIDLAAPVGTPVLATSDGVVSTADWNGGYGLFIALEHGGGLQTRYGHMSRLNVGAGQQVRKGDVIGFVGSTGLSTGPHVHYEVRVNGQAVNPLHR